MIIQGESSEELKARVKKAAAARLKKRRTVSSDLLANETEEVKAEIEAELAKIKRKKLEGKTESDAVELTPELAQK